MATLHDKDVNWGGFASLENDISRAGTFSTSKRITDLCAALQRLAVKAAIFRCYATKMTYSETLRDKIDNCRPKM
ncbi:hypothetical protein [Paraburkholderia sediminicola]|uniref:hypothetical protein n=1 Tax=Paraburkholderia sediminicola TaxID=458836 RepID=UPI0038B95B11